MTAKILGLAKLKKKLDRLPVLAKAQIRAAMEKSADEIVAMMKNLVPVDSGDLRDSIGWTWGKAPKGSLAIAQAKDPGGLTLTIYAGDKDAYYARFVEFGTVAHANGGKFAGTRNPGAKAQPFFYPAYRANRKRAKSRITRAINKAAKAVAAGQ